MVQPKYNPKDALERVKLLMKYDSSKTLTENKEEVNESWSATAAGWLAGAGLTKILAGSAALGLFGKGATAAAIAGAGVFWPALAAAGLAGTIYWLNTKDTGAERVKGFFQHCSANKQEVSKIGRIIKDPQLKTIANNIENSVYHQEWGFLPGGTDEEKLFASFKEMETGSISDFCRLIEIYNQQSKSKDLWDDLDSDLDQTDEWDTIYNSIRVSFENSVKEVIEDLTEICKSNPDDPRCPKVEQPNNTTGTGGEETVSQEDSEEDFEEDLTNYSSDDIDNM